jgi:hypothetical protein
LCYNKEKQNERGKYNERRNYKGYRRKAEEAPHPQVVEQERIQSDACGAVPHLVWHRTERQNHRLAQLSPEVEQRKS